MEQEFKSKPKVVDEKTMQEFSGQKIMYNYGDENQVNLPNVEEILDTIIKIYEVMDTDEIKTVRKENKAQYEIKMEELFPAFSFRYYAVFRKVISGEDITPLMRMFDEINNVKSGKKTIEQAEQQLGQNLAEQYIYPKLNRKQKRKMKLKQ